MVAARAWSQTPALITLKAGEEMSTLYQHIYKYPAFTNGRIYFANDSARSLFNYNQLDDRMEFIGEKNDTLVIADERSVRQVIINRDSFYHHDGGYLLLLGDYGFAKLLVKDKLKLLDEKNIGSYGIPTSTHTIENKKTLLSLQTMTLQLNKDLIFSREQYFYFLAKGSYQALTRKTLLKILNPTEKDLVASFIYSQAIDLKKLDDIERLFQYIKTVKKQ